MTSSFSREVTVLALMLLLVLPCTAAGYTVQPGYVNPPPVSSEPQVPAGVPLWELPPWILLAAVCAGACGILAAVKVLAALGFRRVNAGNVLAHPTRERVFLTIRQNPGIHLRGLAREAAVGLGTLRHHLAMLLAAKKITGRRDDSALRFYENGGTYSAAEQVLLRHLRNPTRAQILRILAEGPGTGRNEIARVLGLSGSTVTWHMHVLAADGIVKTDPATRAALYEIDDTIRPCLAARLSGR